MVKIGLDTIVPVKFSRVHVGGNFVVASHVSSAVLHIIDPDQYGGIPKSSIALALLSITHHWSMATDCAGAAVRAVLFDYRKAFDLINHRLPADKIFKRDIPRGFVRWVLDFLSNQKQRMKLASAA